MFARIRNVLVAILLVGVATAGVWWLSGGPSPFSESSSDFTPRYDGYTTFSAADLGDDECIALDDNMEQADVMRFGDAPYGGDTSFVLVEEVAGPAVAPISGVYAGRSAHNLLCQTADEIAKEEERLRLSDLLHGGKACYLDEGDIVAYAESEFSHRDRSMNCVSDAEAEADDERAAEFIAELDSVPRDGDWTDRAEMTVTLYCDLKEQWGGSFVLAENKSKVNRAFTELYELDRSYTPGYPREFEDAVADWCGEYESSKGEPLPPPETNPNPSVSRNEHQGFGHPYPPEMRVDSSYPGSR